MTTTLTQFEEEKLGEFDQNQRLFLAGRYHSTKFNDWFLDVLHQQREMMRKDLLEIAGQGEYEDLRREVENYFPLPNKEIKQ